MIGKFGKRCFLHKTYKTLRVYIGLLLLHQCVTNAVGDDDNTTTTENSIATTPGILPNCNSEDIGNEIRATMYEMLKYSEKCNQTESEHWRTTWFANQAHNQGNAWHKKVCNFFLLQLCNGSHCVCGGRKTFGSDLQYVSRVGDEKEQQTCLAKDMELCSHHSNNFKKELKLNPYDTNEAKIVQYVVPAHAWGNEDCTGKINLDCATDGFWCQPVKEENQKFMYYTRCVRKAFANGHHGGGPERFHVNSELLVLLLGIGIMGMNVKF